jgi:tRNA threonylcarbamoyladenosine biosynthesis protein TsaB
VGLACIKGLAEGAARPAVAISNLKAIASFGTAPLRAVHVDARRNEIYGAVYDGRLQLVCPEVVMPKDAWLAGLPAGAELVNAPPSLAAAIAQLAPGESPQDPAALDANYVRRSDAELFWKE